jgi:GNAT superfamily N-acetyltransferase
MNGLHRHGSASCVIKDSILVPKEMRKGLRELTKLHTPAESRGKGHATALLHDVCAKADEAGVLLLLHVEPYAQPDMTKAQLEAWYVRFGFQMIQPDPLLMARMVGGTPRVLSLPTRAVGCAIEAM